MATKRKDGLLQKSFRIELPDKTKKRVFVYGKTVAELNKKMAQYKTAIENGRTFEDVANEWWDIHSETLAPNSLKNYTPAVNRAIDNFGAYYIKDITAAQINAWIRFLAIGYADKTVRTHLMVVNLIMLYAVNAGDLQYNPAATVRIPRNLPKTKITAPERRDIDIILNSVNAPFGLFPFMALTTGMRRGELLALEWSDIQNGVIHISKSLYWQYNKPEIKFPKTESGTRVVPVLDVLAPHLKKRHRGLVFPAPGGSYLTEGQFQTLIKNYKKNTGVKCTMHQLRHAFATMLYENGIDPKDAQKILGHAQVSTTLDIYTDISRQKQEQTFDKLRGVKV